MLTDQSDSLSPSGFRIIISANINASDRSAQVNLKSSLFVRAFCGLAHFQILFTFK